MIKHLKGLNGVTIVVVTVITVLGLLSMIPTEERILPELLTGYLPYGSIEDKTTIDSRYDFYFDYITDLKEDISPKEELIDDVALDRFIEVYTYNIKGKKAALEVPEENRQEIRVVLENMGHANMVELRELLKQEMNEEMLQRVKIVLGENLFDSEIKQLDELMEIK